MNKEDLNFLLEMLGKKRDKLYQEILSFPSLDTEEGRLHLCKMGQWSELNFVICVIEGYRV